MRPTTPTLTTALASLALALGLSAWGCSPQPTPAIPEVDPGVRPEVEPDMPNPNPIPAWKLVPMLKVEPDPMPSGSQWMPVSDLFPGVDIHGSFANDVGMMWEGARIDGKYYPQDRMGPVVLAAAGWSQAEPEARKAIAEAYCRGFLQWRVEEEADADFARDGAPAFTAPHATCVDGTATFTAWTNDPTSTMRPSTATNYRQHQAVFHPDGSVTTTIVASYDAPLKRD